VRVVLGLLAESIRESGEVPVLHLGREVLALDVRCTYILRIGISNDVRGLDANALCRAVASVVPALA
jgi:hypothetical protein